MKLTKITIIFCIFIALSAFFLLHRFSTKQITPTIIQQPIAPAKPNITINGHTFTIELAKTTLEQQKGLSDRDSLPLEHGMLFIFNQKMHVTFWMKGMRIPLDIIFINDDKVSSVVHNAPAPISETVDLPRYKPEEPINKALEINAGLSKKYNIKKGDTVKISL